ncbi:S10 family peptidase [Chelatococcus sp. GCM10030263]|uniref:S10 family peptidase n=1 Tax=Chelatococcus sp. GCM10030263 TaxID=3273387 RepID=UPI0036148023
MTDRIGSQSTSIDLSGVPARRRRAGRASAIAGGMQAALISLTLISVVPQGLAQPAPAGQAGQGTAQRQRENADAGQENERLPAPVTTHHVLPASLGGQRYAATAGSIVLSDQAGRPTAEIAYVAYSLEGQDPTTRPITFAFNGGPGAASAYLHFGALGPQRLAFGNQGDGPSKPPTLVDNSDTWLPFTDLVFIDPVGTGYSRFLRDDQDLRRQIWSVSGDIQVLSRFVTRYLTENGRLRSPKLLAGESYGGFRVPKIAHALQGDYGVGVAGLYIISPVLDFGLRSGGLPLGSAARLPSLAAAARVMRGETVTREALADAEHYALSAYIADVLSGPRDTAAVERIISKVADLTGLDRAFLARFGGQPDLNSIAHELERKEGQVASYYDALVTGIDPTPWDVSGDFDDPVLDASRAPLTTAAVDYTRRVLDYPVTRPYELLNGEVSRRWSWGAGRQAAEAMSDLRAALALDPKLTVVVAHGFTDLVTPYLESQIALNRLPATLTDPDRVRLEVMPGGHMFYTRDGSRAQLKASAERLVARVTGDAAREGEGPRP